VKANEKLVLWTFWSVPALEPSVSLHLIGCLLDNLVYQILKEFRNTNNLYVVVPEVKQQQVLPVQSHYKYNQFQYPRLGERGYLPCTAAAEGEFIYSRKRLAMIEGKMGIWVGDQVRAIETSGVNL
jgi:hypothetical protein